MSGKLDQSLDAIVKTQKQSRRRIVKKAKPSAAVVGGINKSTKPAKTITKAVPVAPATGESKILVSGLPADVTESQIKDYFAKTIGPVKRVFLTYGPNGQSRGISTIVFSRPGSAQDAATQLNGVKVDNRAMKIEVILGADRAAAAAVPRKALKERIAQPKAANKPTVAAKPNGEAAKGRGRVAKRGRAGGRPKSKTVEELDTEMADYFGPKTANGNAAAKSGDVQMDDQIL